jgi:hypothetical protein
MKSQGFSAYAQTTKLVVDDDHVLKQLLGFGEVRFWD